jgi:signal transduction histidine kinase
VRSFFHYLSPGKLKLQGQVFVYFAGLVLFIIIFVSVAIFYFQSRLLLHMVQEKAIGLTRTLAYTSLNAILQDDYMVLQNLIDSMMGGDDIVSIAILDTTGKVMASSEPERRGQLQNDAVTRQAVTAGNLIVKKTGSRGSEEFWDMAIPIFKLNQPVGIARVKYSVKDPFSGLIKSILVIGISAIVISLLLAWYFSRSISRPIRQTVRLAAEYGRGNLDASIDLYRKDEIGELVTSLNKLSNELKILIDEKVANENLIMMGEFASYIIHDLKNPLSGIHLLSDGLHRKISPESPLKKYSIEILLATQRLHDFVERTLDIARWSRVNPQPLNPSELIREVVKSIDCGQIPITLELDERLTEIQADYQMLVMVVKNLLTNAIEAVDGNGGVVVRTGMGDGEAIIEVQDTGCGISSRDLKTIFRPFFSMKKQGHGLGLAMVRKAVMLHKGKIIVESEEGSGSLFRITLPLVSS